MSSGGEGAANKTMGGSFHAQGTQNWPLLVKALLCSGGVQRPFKVCVGTKRQRKIWPLLASFLLPYK
jgi:hypothetical protein